jgi:recombination protein RecA
MSIKRIRKILTQRRRPVKTRRQYLPTGLTLLNLACSGRRTGGFPAGRYVFLVGDSASGKTFLVLTCFAEAGLTRHFSRHRLIYMDVEGGALMDLKRYFGKTVAQRIEVFHPETIEEFYDLMDDFLADGRPFLCVLDSMDGLTSEAEHEKFHEQKTARRNGRAAPGTFGADKAKKNSAGIRALIGGLQRTGSLLVVVSQTRDHLGFGYEKKTRSGGRALRFYANLELWTAIKRRIKKKVAGQPRQVGIICEVEIKKNRNTGREVTVEFPIYYSTGLDDTGANVAYLIREGHWQARKGTVQAPEFKHRGPVEKLIRKIEAQGREEDLRRLVADVWREIEEGCHMQRKNRYL